MFRIITSLIALLFGICGIQFSWSYPTSVENKHYECFISEFFYPSDSRAICFSSSYNIAVDSDNLFDTQGLYHRVEIAIDNSSRDSEKEQINKSLKNYVITLPLLKNGTDQFILILGLKDVKIFRT